MDRQEEVLHAVVCAFAAARKITVREWGGGVDGKRAQYSARLGQLSFLCKHRHVTLLMVHFGCDIARVINFRLAEENLAVRLKNWGHHRRCSTATCVFTSHPR